MASVKVKQNTLVRLSNNPQGLQLLTDTAMVVPAKRPAEADPETTMASDITVAKRGDVRLKLGKAGQTPTNVLVSSYVLSLASPVFEAMFNGNFAEGQSLSSHSPREVPLPDDDLESMLLICRITHMQTTELAEELSVGSFTEFAFAADKYQCGKAVQAWSRLWTAAIFQHPPGEDFEKMILATYVLDMPYEFYKATVILVRDRSTDAKIATMGAHILPLEIFDTLHSNKRQVEVQAYTVFSTLAATSRTCKTSYDTTGRLMESLRDSGNWPVVTRSVSEMKGKVAKMQEVTKSCTSWTCACSSYPTNIKSSAVIKMDQVYNSVKGICLDCIKSHALDGTVQCRIKHDANGFMQT
jgi:hypothetical protein